VWGSKKYGVVDCVFISRASVARTKTRQVQEERAAILARRTNELGSNLDMR
jgi:hypothetical protein